MAYYERTIRKIGDWPSRQARPGDLTDVPDGWRAEPTGDPINSTGWRAEGLTASGALQPGDEGYHHVEFTVGDGPSPNGWWIVNQYHLKTGGTQPTEIVSIEGGQFKIKTSKGGGHVVYYSEPLRRNHRYVVTIKSRVSATAAPFAAIVDGVHRGWAQRVTSDGSRDMHLKGGSYCGEGIVPAPVTMHLVQYSASPIGQFADDAPPPPPDVEGPVVRVPGIAEGAILHPGVRVPWLVEADDPSGIAKVEWYFDGALILTETQKPYGDTAGFWTVPDAPGPHMLRNTAYDTKGNSTSVERPIQIVASDPPPPVPSPQSGFGVSMGLGGPRTDTEWAAAAELAPGGWVRLEANAGNVPWGSGNGSIIGEITLVVAKGLRPLVQLMPVHPGTMSPADYATFCGTFVQRFPVVDWVELWNEPNNPNFWTGTRQEYSAILKAGYAAVKAADPTMGVLTGSPAPGQSVSCSAWVAGLYADGCKGFFDAVGHHPYNPPPGGDPAWGQTNDIRATMVANGDGAKQVWGTESGWHTFLSGDRGLTESQQADHAAALVSGWRAFGSWAGPFMWYTLTDKPGAQPPQEAFFGLIRADGTRKPAFASYQAAIAGVPPPPDPCAELRAELATARAQLQAANDAVATFEDYAADVTADLTEIKRIAELGLARERP